MKYGFHSGSIYLCVCIGLDYAFASIHFFVGLAWGVCVLHCSAWMWLCFHWIISALLSLYQLFALSETDPQKLVCVCFNLHVWLVNYVCSLWLIGIIINKYRLPKKEPCICNMYHSCVLLNGSTVLVCGCLLFCDARELLLFERAVKIVDVCVCVCVCHMGVCL